MRLRLLLRRLTVSAPRMAVRSALPWPFRWVAVSVVLGLCAAIGLWAFEFGREIAGLDRGTKEELQIAQTALVSLRAELAAVTQARDKAQAVANTADTVMTAEKVAQTALLAQNRQLEIDNQKLRDDLGFFEKLIPNAGASGIAIRGLQVELVAGQQVKWQVMVIQPVRNPALFNGRLELTFSGIKNSQAWTMTLPDGPQAVTIKQYGRMEGVFQLPAKAVLKSVTAKIMEGAAVKAVQSIKL